MHPSLRQERERLAGELDLLERRLLHKFIHAPNPWLEKVIEFWRENLRFRIVQMKFYIDAGVEEKGQEALHTGQACLERLHGLFEKR